MKHYLPYFSILSLHELDVVQLSPFVHKYIQIICILRQSFFHVFKVCGSKSPGQLIDYFSD